MKKLLALAILLIASNSYAVQLHNFEEVKKAVTEGKLIRLFLNYSKCNSSTYMMVPNDGAVHTMNEIALTSDGHIVNWVMHFTMNKPQFPSKPVYEYIRYVISNDNSVVLSYTSLNALDYTPLGDSGTLTCKIEESAKFFVN